MCKCGIIMQLLLCCCFFCIAVFYKRYGIMKKEKVLEIYRRENKRVTKAKLKILDFFETQKNFADVTEVTKALDNTADISTVYRNLEYLEKIGYLEIINKDDRRFYRKTQDYTKHNHYLVCEVCGKKEKIDFCPFVSMDDEIPDGFVVKSHVFELIGICKDCRKKKDEKKSTEKQNKKRP